jgi:uncharacterized protein (UPF0332 family)
MESSEFIKSANTLVKGSNEVDYRNAISRAYYGAFHACSDLASQNNLDSIGSCHERLVSALKSHPKFVSIANKLHDAKGKRTIADYNLSRKMTQSEAKNIVRKCIAIQGEVNLLKTQAS